MMTRAGVIVALAAMTGAVPLASPAGAATYTYSATGYDASYPQGSSTPPSNTSFAIIGVTHGRPFTTNPYASTQWSAANNDTSTTPSSLYFNTGYALAYAKSDTTNCKSSSQMFQPTGVSGHTLSALQAAWAIGCSEAAWAVSSEPGTPAMWWADVETGNSWSTNAALNQATITGMVQEMSSTNIPVGVYSTPSMWASITGSGFVVSGVAGDWQAGLKTCSSTTSGFTLSASDTHAPLLLAQYGTVNSGGTTYDTDLAC